MSARTNPPRWLRRTISGGCTFAAGLLVLVAAASPWVVFPLVLFASVCAFLAPVLIAWQSQPLPAPLGVADTQPNPTEETQ